MHSAYNFTIRLAVSFIFFLSRKDKKVGWTSISTCFNIPFLHLRHFYNFYLFKQNKKTETSQWLLNKVSSWTPALFLELLPRQLQMSLRYNSISKQCFRPRICFFFGCLSTTICWTLHFVQINKIKSSTKASNVKKSEKFCLKERAAWRKSADGKKMLPEVRSKIHLEPSIVYNGFLQSFQEQHKGGSWVVSLTWQEYSSPPQFRLSKELTFCINNDTQVYLSLNNNFFLFQLRLL